MNTLVAQGVVQAATTPTNAYALFEQSDLLGLVINAINQLLPIHFAICQERKGSDDQYFIGNSALR
jgi:hypothetical protein